jgi:S1-C subfamily serine protease
MPNKFVTIFSFVFLGNPIGLESTVSAGIVSAVRDIPAPNNS